MDTPVLLIAWRRPQTLRQVINAIRPVAPTRLFVACDGPNPDRPGEAEKVAATRDLIEQEIDWPCQIERLYSDVNQGCREGPVKAISWFFNQVKEGIILEDDCVPSTAFFQYCEWALSAFRDDRQVMHINGNNFAAPLKLINDEVTFVALPQVWGWASWSDRWEFFEGNPFYLSRQSDHRRWSLSLIARCSKLKHLDSLKKGLDAWDYQWQITVLNRRGLAVCPRVNLISNVGVGSDATHTFNDKSRTFLKTGGFKKPSVLPPVKNNPRLSQFFEKKMGLNVSLKLVLWLMENGFREIRSLIRRLSVIIFFGNFTPIVIASTGRAGSTMLTSSIALSLIQYRYPFLPSAYKKWLAKFAQAYFDRLEDINAFNRSPVIKTHDLFRSDLKCALKYIFVYGDPFDSAASALVQGEIRGSTWLDEHIFHLCGHGSPDQILEKDVLNYEAQILAWEKSPAFFIHYSDFWSRQDELSRYLGFSLMLPPWRARSDKQLTSGLRVNRALFDRLSLIEKRFRASGAVSPADETQ